MRDALKKKIIKGIDFFRNPILRVKYTVIVMSTGKLMNYIDVDATIGIKKSA